jgi:hypothetical protein
MAMEYDVERMEYKVLLKKHNNTGFVEGERVGESETVNQPVLNFGSGRGGQIVLRKKK